MKRYYTILIISVLVFAGCVDRQAPVSGISIEPESMELAVGETVLLEAAISPEDAGACVVAWTSSNPEVAEVSSSGEVSANSPGLATITAKSGEISDVCNITVTGDILYAAGTYVTTEQGYEPYYKPCYWKNDKMFILDIPDNHDASVNGISVVGDDVYVFGSYLDRESGSDVGCYWKNGERIDVSATGVDGFGNICLYDSEKGCFSVNGKAVYLEIADGYSRLSVTNAAVCGNDVYAIGNCHADDSSLEDMWCYWKNGKFHELGLPFDDGSWCIPWNIAVDGNDVYVIGEYFQGVDGYVCYWKNGEVVLMPELGKGTTWANMYVLSGNIYICGSRIVDNSYYKLFVWNNGTSYDMNDNLHTSVQSDIVVSDEGNVYICGSDGYGTGDDVNGAFIWKNGDRKYMTAMHGMVPRTVDALQVVSYRSDIR